MKNRVLLLLVALIPIALWLPYLTLAPNRIVTPQGISLLKVLSDTGLWVFLLPLALLVVTIFLQPSRTTYVLTILVSTICLTTAFWLAGHYAEQFGQNSGGLARISLGGGFWLLLLLCWLIAMDAIARLTSSTAYRSLGALLVFLPVLVLMASGTLSHLSMAKEYSNNKGAFDDALTQHLFIVGLTLAITLVIGIPLGVMAFRRANFGSAALKTLSVIQTIPSIALFGLLIAPLSALVVHYPLLANWGIKGIGVTPAVIALTLYSLLPIVRSMVAGLSQVSPAVTEAARGMGMTEWQILWRVQTPLALPVLLSGVRVTTVQAVGLTMVAALVGAGGFGAIMFRGLSGSAIDLVLLGVIPVIILAVCVDALFKIIVSFLDKRGTSDGVKTP